MIQKYPHMADGTYEMKPEHTEDVAELFAEMFSRKNVIWSKATIEHLKLKQFFMETIHNHFELQKKAQQALGRNFFYNTLSIENGNIDSLSLHYDIEQYRTRNSDSKTPQIPLFKTLERFGSKLTEKIDLNSYEPGKTIYVNFGGRSAHQKHSKMTSVHLMAETYEQMRGQGYRYVIGRISNDIMKGYYQDLGSKVVSSVAFDIGKGNMQNLYFISLDLENPTLLKRINEAKETRKKAPVQAKL